MIHHKPQVEKWKYINTRATSRRSEAFVSPMTRQALFRLLSGLKQKYVFAPRFIPAGAYHPIVLAGKEIVYYDVPSDLRIDWSSVRTTCPDPANTIVYYIHHFGLHIESNIVPLRQLQHEGYFVIDDRSLTLPTSHYSEFADATPYSFYKLVGTACGAEVRLKQRPEYDSAPEAEVHDELLSLMARTLYFYGNPAVKLMPTLPFRVLNRLIARYVGFNHVIGDTKYYSAQGLPLKMQKRLSQVDYDLVTKRRIEVARRYLNRIESKFLLPLAPEAYSVQSCMGFPILVDNPGPLVKYLIRRGIYSFRFTDIWWWDKNNEPNELYNRNVLLPAHHHLRDKDVDYIIDCVNSYAGRAV